MKKSPKIDKQEPSHKGKSSKSEAKLSSSQSLDQHILGLHRTIGNRAVGQMLQAKLSVSQQNDKYEQEADRTAEQVMRMPEPQVQNGIASRNYLEHSSTTAAIQKKEGTVPISGEKGWTVTHPQGRITKTAPDKWILWNFDVASEELKFEHIMALREIYERWLTVKQLDKNAKIVCYAHASESGSEQINRKISRHRFDSVEKFFTEGDFEEKPKVNGTYYGKTWPWITSAFSGLTEEEMARNRRVNVNIHYTPRTIARPEKTEEHPPAGPEGERGTEKDLLKPLDIAGKWEYPVKGAPIFIKDLFILYPEGKFEFSAKISEKESTGELEIQPDNVEIKAKLNEIFNTQKDIELSLDKDKLELKTKFENFELGGAFDFTKGPVGVVSYRPFAFEPAEIALEGGRKIIIEWQLKLTIKIGPNPLLLRRAGTKLAQVGRGIMTGATEFGTWAVTAPAGIATTAIAGGVAGTALLLLGASYLVSEAKEEGRRKALMGHRVGGFSLRVAGEVMENNEMYNTAVRKLEELRNKGEKESKAAWEGWTAAGLILLSIPENGRSIFYKKIKARYGPEMDKISDNITRMIGAGTNWSSDALPKTAEDLFSL